MKDYPQEFKALPEWAQKTLKRHIQPDGKLSGGIVIPEYSEATYLSARVLKFTINGAEVFWISNDSPVIRWRNWNIHQGRAIPSEDANGFQPGVYVAVTQPDRIVLFPRHTKLQDLTYVADQTGNTWGKIGDHEIPTFWTGQMGGVPWKYQNVILFANPGTGGVSGLFDLGYAFMTGELNESTNWFWKLDWVTDSTSDEIEKQYRRIATFSRPETEKE